MSEPEKANTGPTKQFGWKHVFLLTGLVLAARVIFLRFFCRFELVGDEAQYWDWARHVDWSYYTKGPGIAWTIWLSTRLFGDDEWAVRLPAAIAAAVSMLAMAGLASDVSKGSARAAFYGAVSYLLFLIGLGLGLLITIDSPYLACWALSAWAAWRGAQAMGRGEAGTLPWLAFGVALGAGFLYKYTALLLVPGIALYLVWDRKNLKFTGRAWGAILAGLGLVVIAMLPVVIWNSNHHWVTIKHLFGHMQVAGGDTMVNTSWKFDPMTMVDFIGVQIGAVGPLTAGLILCAVWAAFGRKGQSVALRASDGTPLPSPPPKGEGAAREPNADRFLLACALPILLFYLVVSIRKEVEGNWPIAGYITLLVMVAKLAPVEFDRLRALNAQWIADGKPAKPRRGFLRARPETLFQVLWHWAVGTSVVIFLGIFMLGFLLRFEFMRTAVPTWRFSGMAEAGKAVAAVREEFQKTTGETPFLMASGYETTALLSYYTPGRPQYVSASSEMGQRQSSYDYFEDTNWRNPALLGRPVVLAGTAPELRWRLGYKFVDLKDAGFSRYPGTPEHRMIRIFTAREFQGPMKEPVR
jgi:4-amino-4-deoxy-L-arabinose transferase-like glycosyltransferase